MRLYYFPIILAVLFSECFQTGKLHCNTLSCFACSLVLIHQNKTKDHLGREKPLDEVRADSKEVIFWYVISSAEFYVFWAREWKVKAFTIVLYFGVLPQAVKTPGISAKLTSWSKSMDEALRRRMASSLIPSSNSSSSKLSSNAPMSPLSSHSGHSVDGDSGGLWALFAEETTSGDSVRSVDASPGSLGGCWPTGEVARDVWTLAIDCGVGLRAGWFLGGCGEGVGFLVGTAVNARTVFGRSAESSFDSVGLCQNNEINRIIVFTFGQHNTH